MDAEILPESAQRVPRKGAPTVETPRGASLRRRPRPCRALSDAPRARRGTWDRPLRPGDAPRGVSTVGGPDGIATFEAPSQCLALSPRILTNGGDLSIPARPTLKELLLGRRGGTGYG